MESGEDEEGEVFLCERIARYRMVVLHDENMSLTSRGRTTVLSIA